MRFGSESERDRALSEMAGHIISNRPVRVSIATAKKSPALAAAGVSPGGVSGQVLLGDMDPTNTTLFIGGLNAAVRLFWPFTIPLALRAQVVITSPSDNSCTVMACL